MKVALPRPLMFNNTTHRPATIQRIRIGATRDGKITAIGHESWSGDLPGGKPEAAVSQTRLLYAGANRMTATRLAVLDLPEGNAMRAPGEAPGMMALEIAMDEMAEKLGIDPVEFRILNDTQVDPGEAGAARSRSASWSSACAPAPSASAGASAIRSPARRRDGRWLVGMGVAAAFRNNLLTKSAARVRLDSRGIVTVETDMTDIGTGSYTIIAQTAAEMMGVPLDKVVVRLGDSTFPVSCRLGRAMGRQQLDRRRLCRLRQAARGRGAEARLQLRRRRVRRRRRSARAIAACRSPRPRATASLVAEDAIEYGDLDKKYQQSTFGAHFVEVGVDAATGRDPRAPHARGLRRGPHPQPEDRRAARSSAR